MKVEVSIVIDRPVATVWEFYAVYHVENHPRWDPDLELELVSDGVIGLGSVISRKNTRYETPTEGTMEIVEFLHEQRMGVKIHDGPITTNGWAAFEAVGDSQTGLSLGAEFPGMDESMSDKIRPLMERSARTIKQLIESET
jgi:hypothetical protein